LTELDDLVVDDFNIVNAQVGVVVVGVLAVFRVITGVVYYEGSLPALRLFVLAVLKFLFAFLAIHLDEAGKILLDVLAALVVDLLVDQILHAQFVQLLRLVELVVSFPGLVLVELTERAPELGVLVLPLVLNHRLEVHNGLFIGTHLLLRLGPLVQNHWLLVVEFTYFDFPVQLHVLVFVFCFSFVFTHLCDVAERVYPHFLGFVVELLVEVFQSFGEEVDGDVDLLLAGAAILVLLQVELGTAQLVQDLGARPEFGFFERGLVVMLGQQ